MYVQEAVVDMVMQKAAVSYGGAAKQAVTQTPFL